MVAALREGRLDPEDLIDETGNVPADVLYSGFFMLAPTTIVAQRATLLENLWNDEFVRGFQATRLFSPNGDQLRDTARVSFRMNEPGTVTVAITDPADRGGAVRRVLFEGPRAAAVVRSRPTSSRSSAASPTCSRSDTPASSTSSDSSARTTC